MLPSMLAAAIPADWNRCSHRLCMCHAAAERDRRLAGQVFAVVAKAVAHDGADTLLSLLGVKVAHPLAQAGC
jgi:hypothetical protein